MRQEILYTKSSMRERERERERERKRIAAKCFTLLKIFIRAYICYAGDCGCTPAEATVHLRIHTGRDEHRRRELGPGGS